MARAVEVTKDEIHKVVRGAKDTLAGGNEWADFSRADNHATFGRPTLFVATLGTRLPRMHLSILART